MCLNKVSWVRLRQKIALPSFHEKMIFAYIPYGKYILLRYQLTIEEEEKGHFRGSFANNYTILHLAHNSVRYETGISHPTLGCKGFMQYSMQISDTS